MRKADERARLVDLDVLKLEPVHRTLTPASVHDEAGGLWNAKAVQVRQSRALFVQLRQNGGVMMVRCRSHAQRSGHRWAFKGKATAGKVGRQIECDCRSCCLVVQGDQRGEGVGDGRCGWQPAKPLQLCSHVNNKQEKRRALASFDYGRAQGPGVMGCRLSQQQQHPSKPSYPDTRIHNT